MLTHTNTYSAAAVLLSALDAVSSIDRHSAAAVVAAKTRMCLQLPLKSLEAGCLRM